MHLKRISGIIRCKTILQFVSKQCGCRTHLQFVQAQFEKLCYCRQRGHYLWNEALRQNQLLKDKGHLSAEDFYDEQRASYWNIYLLSVTKNKAE